MRPEFDNEIMRAAMPGVRPGIKFITFSGWRELDSATPTTPQASDPLFPNARNKGSSASVSEKQSIFRLRKPTQFLEDDPRENKRHIFLGHPNGNVGYLWYINDTLSPRSQSAAIGISIKAIYEDFDLDAATWQNKVTAPDVDMSSQQFTTLFQFPYFISDLVDPDVPTTAGTFPTNHGDQETMLTSFTSVLFTLNQSKKVHGFLVASAGGMGGSIYGGGSGLTNFACTLRLGSALAGDGFFNPRIEW